MNWSLLTIIDVHVDVDVVVVFVVVLDPLRGHCFMLRRTVQIEVCFA